MSRAPRRGALREAWAAALALGVAAASRAQPRFPERAITLLVPFAPGGIADLRARAVAGVPGCDVASWNVIAVPAGTPGEVVAALNRAVREAVGSAAVRDKLGRAGMRLSASTPAELQALLAGEIRRWGEVIRAARIEPE